MNACRGSQKPIFLTATIFVVILVCCLRASAGVFVLYTGGFDGNNTYYSVAELYDPSLKTFSLTNGPMATARTVHAQAVLQDGKVLVVGGQSDGATTYANPSAEVFDPSSGTFTATTGSMTTGRIGPTATTLPNGLVLIVGGVLNADGGFASLNTAELYDPSTGLFTATGSMAVARQGHTATLLADGSGRVLIAGGRVASGVNTDTVELYDPATGIFTSTSSMMTVRVQHAAVLLSTGEVLVMGGYDNSSELKSAELYNLSTGQFTVTGSMTDGRGNFWPALLPAVSSDDQVLVAGGQQQPSGTILSSAEVYSRTTQTWTKTGSMLTPRYEYTLYNNGDLLPDGTVLISGGTIPPCCATITAAAELYDPLSGTFSATGPMVLPTQGYGDPLIGGSTGALTDKVQVRFHYSANGSPGNWSDAKKVSSTGVIAIGPVPLEGNLIVRPGDLLRFGYDFKLSNQHVARALSFTQAIVRFSPVCTGSGKQVSLNVRIPDKTYPDPVNSTAWYPSGNQSDSSVYQGSFAVPDLCSGGTMTLKKGGLFGAQVGEQ